MYGVLYNNLLCLFRKVTLVGESEHLLGVAEKCLSSAELSAVNSFLADVWLSAICDGQAVKKRVRVRNSYTVQYSGGVGQICNFVVIDGLEYVLVLIYKLLRSTNVGYRALDLSVSIAAVSRGPIISIPSTELQRKCVFISGSTSSYVVSFPNSHVQILLCFVCILFVNKSIFFKDW